jgi:hypothetical protein
MRWRGCDGEQCVSTIFPEFLIAADRAQFGVRQPLPRRAFLFQVIEKAVRTRDQWPFLPCGRKRVSTR